MVSSDLYEHRYNGYYCKVELSCGHTFAFYYGVHDGYMLREPIVEEKCQLHPIGMMSHLPEPYYDLERALGEGQQQHPVFKIRCPEHQKRGDYTFKMIEKRWLDMDYTELNPYTKYIPICGLSSD